MKWNENFLNYNIAKDFILVPAGDSNANGIFVLNESGKKIVELLKAGKDRDEIIEVLCKEYEGSNTAEVTECVNGYIKKLREIGAIIDD